MKGNYGNKPTCGAEKNKAKQSQTKPIAGLWLEDMQTALATESKQKRRLRPFRCVWRQKADMISNAGV